MKQTIVFFFLLLFTLSCQEEIEPNFSFTNEQEEITLEGDANSETTFSFSSSREWEATTTSNWLSISPTSGEAGSQRITLTATSENATGTTRSATVLLTSLTLTHEITVKQSASDFVALEQETYQIPAAGDIVNIQFLTNVEDDELSIFMELQPTGWYKIQELVPPIHISSVCALCPTQKKVPEQPMCSSIKKLMENRHY